MPATIFEMILFIAAWALVYKMLAVLLSRHLERGLKNIIGHLFGKKPHIRIIDADFKAGPSNPSNPKPK